MSIVVKLATGFDQEGFNTPKPKEAEEKQAPFYATAARERNIITRVDQASLVRQAYERFWTPQGPSTEVQPKYGHRGGISSASLFKDEYVPLYEDAWIKNKGKIPLDFFLQFEAVDLQNFVHTIEPEVAQDLYGIWMSQAHSQAIDKQVEDELNKRLSTDERVRGVGSFIPFTYEKPALTDADKTAMREQIRKELTSAPAVVDNGFWHDANKVAPLFMGPVGWAGFSKGMTATDIAGFTMNKGMEAIAPLLGTTENLPHEGIFGFFNPIGLIMSWRESELEAQRVRDMEEIRSATGYGEAYGQQRSWNDARVEWDQMSPREKAFYLDAAGGSEVTAMGLFVSDRNADPEVKDQMAQYISEYDASIQDSVKTLQETEFSDKDKLLDGLAAWGNLTGDFAVGFLLLVDGDEHLNNMDFAGYFNEIKEYNHSPAEFMGWEGTVLGIGFDFGMMALFDPTTYMFGGGAASASGRGVARTAEQATRILEGAEQLAKREEMAVAVMSPAVDNAAMATMSGLDGIGKAQLFQLKDMVTPIFRRGNQLWRKAFPSASEVMTEHIASLIPATTTAEDAAKATRAITKRGGFNRPVTVEVGTSGVARIAPADVTAARAAVDNSWNVIPQQVEYFDDLIPGYTPEQATQMQKLKDFQPTAPTAEAERNVLLNMDIWQRQASPTDTVLGTVTRDGQTYTFRSRPFHTWGTQALNVESGRTLWYVVDDAERVVGGYDGTHFLTLPSARGKGIMDEMLTLTESAGDSFLPRLMERAADPATSSFTEDAARFLRAQIAKRLEGKTFLDGAVPIRDVWGDSAKIPDGVTPGVAKPSTLLDTTGLFGSSDIATELKKIYQGQLMRNGRLEDMTYTAIARGFQSLIRKVAGMNENQYAKYLDRFFTQRNLSRTFNSASGHVVEDAFDYLMRLWGDDTPELNKSIQKIIDHQQGVAAKNKLLTSQSARLNELDAQIAALSGEVGILPDVVDDAVREAGAPALVDRAASSAELRALQEEAAAIRAEASKVRATLPSNEDIFKVVDQAVDDYIAKYIETMDSWKEFIDPKTGRLDRSILRKGPNPVKQEGAKGAGRTTTGFAEGTVEDVDKLNRQLKKISSTAPDNYDLGVSALDLAVARELGGAKYMQYSKRRMLHAVRGTGHTMQNAWIIDKVIRPATAAVVTMDEAMRIVHLYGFEAFRMYMQDKMYFTEARVAAAFRGNNPFAREAVGNGASALPARAQERIRRLQDWGAKLRADERTFFDQHGIGYTDIDITDPLYRGYAQQWTTQFTNDSGFRAFMGGPEEFGKWWDESPDAARLRDKTVNVKKNSKPPTKDEIYEGWESMWKILSSEANKAGKLKEFTAAWTDTLAEISATGKNVPLPDSVYDNFIPVRGAQKIAGGPVNRLTDAFFDRFFMDPVNYRRGFIAEMVRATEMKRLRQFYASQGKKIVPDSMLTDVMRLSGYSKGDIGSQEAMAHVWADSNFIPESYVMQNIERTVHTEIENMLYVWNMGSRAGAQSRMLFPFGKPYADMMGFWGRELFKKPILRGVVNNHNYLGLRSMAENLPFNPKTGAMVSRLAATNFYIDRGWIPEEGDSGEGLLPGSESTDLSPIFFLPTEGDDILGSTLPGLGFLPLAFIDMAMNILGPDPVEDPVGYNNMMHDVSEIMPYIEYEQGSSLSRVVGGGTLSTLFSAGVDIQGYFGGKTYFNVTSELGDIGREIRRAREVSVLLADPEVLEDISKITDPELLELYINGLVGDANKAASASHFGETMTRWAVPAKVKYDSTGAELQQVWLDSAAQFPDIFQISPEISLDTVEGKRQYASDIRSKFFDLPGWQRDLMVAANPALAVNMVGSWDWTPKAIDAGFDGTELPYSTGGTPADMLRHDYYVNNGYVRPIQPALRARLIIGQVAEARDNAIKHVYSTVAGEVNGVIWENIEGDSRLMGFFEELQEQYGKRFGTKDARHLWENWYTLEPLLVDIMEQEGEDFSDGRSLGLPTEAKPWSATFPGLDETSKKFAGLEDITLEGDAKLVMDTLGLEYTEGMTGDQLHRLLADELAQNDTLAHGMYRPSWDQYNQERLAFSNSSSAQLTKAKYDSNNAPEWRNALIEWDVRITNLKEQYRDVPQGIPTSVRQEVMDEFNSFIAGSKDKGTIPWETIWEGSYAPVFGPLDWTPPEPLSPFDEDGNKRYGTHTPIINMVVDGDTIIYHEFNDPAKHAVRLLGVSADEYSYDPEAAEADRKRLTDVLENAKANGDRIYLVTDPDRFVTNTDRYGRLLAWLWIGDEPFYFEDEMNPKFTPSGDN